MALAYEARPLEDIHSIVRNTNQGMRPTVEITQIILHFPRLQTRITRCVI